MQVIAGKARRLKLITPPGLHTRPTTDRIKETLFNILQPRLDGCRFLDLFAGSGAIGIEALSRGAASAVFVENNHAAAGCIKKNLSFTRLSEQARLLETDVLAALRRLEAEQQRFDIIFMDPPYDKSWEEKILRYPGLLAILADDSLLITEASENTSFDYLSELGYTIIREKNYKSNKHIFIIKTGDSE